MPLFGQIMPNVQVTPNTCAPEARRLSPRRENLRVSLLAYNELCVFEYGIGLEVFGIPRPEFDHWYELTIVAAEPGPLKAIGNITVLPDAGLEQLPESNVVIVPGWRDAFAEVPNDLIDALNAAYTCGAKIASICSGAFVLAAAGLLDGKRATTHWCYAGILAERFPKIQVEPDVLYIEDKSVFNSAGSAASLDLCLHIVRKDYGAECANTVARRLVLPSHRDGGQKQFLAAPVPHELGGRISPLLDKIRATPDQLWPVSRMAEVTGLTRRTFQRKFLAATGKTPLTWLTETRVAHAADLLETTDLTINSITKASGFRSSETFRREFRRLRGTVPSLYRNKFRHD